MSSELSKENEKLNWLLVHGTGFTFSDFKKGQIRIEPTSDGHWQLVHLRILSTAAEPADLLPDLLKFLEK